MTEEKFTHWIESIFATEEHEIDCHQLQGYLPAFVEGELDGEPTPHASVVKAHLKQCPDCHEVYEGLILVVKTELDTPVVGD